MKENEFLDGVSNIEPDVVERFISMDNKLQKKANKQKPKGIWLRFVAIAACLVLILSAAIVVPMLIEDDPGIIPGTGTTETPDHTHIIFDATVSPEKLNGNSLEFIVGSSVSISGSADSAPPEFEFSTGIAVKAKVVKNHPDKYYKLDVSSEYRPTAYRLIQMETMEVISGENVPQYFLYLIPEYVYVDMSVYDSLLISMDQIGVENYVLKNATQNRMESFELPMFADYQDNPELGNIIAFSNGIFDESLWQNKSWLYGYQFAIHYLDNPEYSDLVVSRGDSERTVISAIKDQYDWWCGGNYQPWSVTTLNFTTKAAKDALEYVKPFTNGVFSQIYQHGKLIFRRYINGCQTEETITIDLLTEEVTYSEVRYTKEDMAQMENISAHLSEKASEYAEQLPIPPHTDPNGKELLCLNLYAWYVKADGKLYGVIKTAWRYQEKDDWYIQYYDDSYILYDMTAGTATDISRDDLLNIVGTRNVYRGEYGIRIDMPM
ncbi:MAG: hypothetical protein E7675_06990 [Ruminococcaceae bacterium]|nr:hypothetical protein [Oscillospiraceae bacterium]